MLIIIIVVLVRILVFQLLDPVRLTANKECIIDERNSFLNFDTDTFRKLRIFAHFPQFVFTSFPKSIDIKVEELYLMTNQRAVFRPCDRSTPLWLAEEVS